MGSGSIKVVVQNDAQYPLRNLVIAHRQNSSIEAVEKTQQFNGIIRKGDPPQYVTAEGTPLQYDQAYVHGKDHWAVTWENHGDLAVYYLVSESDLMREIVHELERSVADAIDDALKEALENPEIVVGIDSAVVTGGIAGPSAAYLLAEDIVKKESAAYLPYRINDSDQELVITLSCDRLKAKFKNDTYHVKCHVYKCKA